MMLLLVVVLVVVSPTRFVAVTVKAASLLNFTPLELIRLSLRDGCSPAVVIFPGLLGILRRVSEEDGASWGSVVEAGLSKWLVEESLLAQEGILSDDACADGSVAERDCRN